MVITYVKVGRSLYWAENWTNCVKNGSVWLVVPITIALPNVPIVAKIRRIKSIIESPLLTPCFGVNPLEVAPASSGSAFILIVLSLLIPFSSLRLWGFGY
jgi:hypothetical protein